MLKIDDPHCPFPSLFLIHNAHFCAFHPFVFGNSPCHSLARLDLPDDLLDSMGSFNHNLLPGNNGSSAQLQLMMTQSVGGMPVGVTLRLSSNVIATILFLKHKLTSLACFSFSILFITFDVFFFEKK